MPTPVTTLLTARAGLEASRGTDTTPTRLLYFGEGWHQQEIATIAPSEKRASYRPTYRAYAGVERNSFDFSGPLSFDDAIWWANLAIKAVASGTGASADKTWTFLPTSTSDDLKSASIQWGYTDALSATQPAYKVTGCVADSLTINWAADEAVTFAAKLVSPGTATQISAYTGSLSDRSVTQALGTLTSFYIDASTIGSTQDSNILEASWTLNNGFQHMDALNGSAYASSVYRPNPQTWSLTFTRVYNSLTERTAYLAKSEQKIRVKTTGPSLGGSTYSLTLDCYGIVDKLEMAESNGIGVEKVTIVPLYDTTATGDFSLTVVNATAALT